MNRITSARTELFQALEPVLPGRVAAVPPAGRPYPPPYIWIDRSAGTTATAGTATTVTVATFPVWISYDGAVKAQVAGVDDLVAKVWDACQTVRTARPESWDVSTVDVGDFIVNAVVVNVTITLGARTLCVEPVQPAPIPPDSVLINA